MNKMELSKGMRFSISESCTTHLNNALFIKIHAIDEKSVQIVMEEHDGKGTIPLSIFQSMIKREQLLLETA